MRGGERSPDAQSLTERRASAVPSSKALMISKRETIRLWATTTRKWVPYKTVKGRLAREE